ncbi:hypothetical protein Bbelb_360290 [Branchiostoma belcheri]|nr:hypothetical protein Bbelb_360290 [Branchiostoma belcheri]
MRPVGKADKNRPGKIVTLFIMRPVGKADKNRPGKIVTFFIMRPVGKADKNRPGKIVTFFIMRPMGKADKNRPGKIVTFFIMRPMGKADKNRPGKIVTFFIMRPMGKADKNRAHDKECGNEYLASAKDVPRINGGPVFGESHNPRTLKNPPKRAGTCPVRGLRSSPPSLSFFLSLYDVCLPLVHLGWLFRTPSATLRQLVEVHTSVTKALMDYAYE